MENERQLLAEATGYEWKLIDQMTDEEVSEELAEIPYNL